jgi:DNA primase
MGAREDTLALNGLTVQTVGHLLGLKLPLKGMASCPFSGHDDGKPSFEVRRGGRGWICYGCDRRGGAIDLVMEMRDLSFLEAKHWLAGTTGITLEGRRPTAAARRTRTVHTPAPVPPTTAAEVTETLPDYALYSALLTGAPLAAGGRHYLQGRGLDDATIARFAIGQMPSTVTVRDLIGLYGFDRVEAAGLLTQKSTPEQPWPIFPRGALLFPYVEAGGIAYIQARLISEQVDGSRWRNLNHRQRRIYNSDVLARREVRSVAICEGAIDVLSAFQLGHEAIGLIGVSARLSEAQSIALRGRQVDLFLDWDPAGDKRAVTMRKELERFGIAVTRKARPSPSAKDVNDYLREIVGKL